MVDFNPKSFVAFSWNVFVNSFFVNPTLTVDSTDFRGLSRE
jgi:hypothetical protein